MTRLYAVFTWSFIVSVLVLHAPLPVQAQIAHDPGPRTGAPGAGKPSGDLTGPQMNLFNAGIAELRNRLMEVAAMWHRLAEQIEDSEYKDK
jgi:hypothetical protein